MAIRPRRITRDDFVCLAYERTEDGFRIEVIPKRNNGRHIGLEKRQQQLAVVNIKPVGAFQRPSNKLA